jgi:hypothetical protein
MTDEKYHDKDPYLPAERPAGDIPGGDRVRFEREGQHEQSIFGGGAQDIEAAIWRNTSFSEMMIGKKIRGVSTQADGLGGGPLRSITINLDDGSDIFIKGDNLEVES